MKFLPRTFNDLLALVMALGLPAFFYLLLWAGFEKEAVLLIIGQALGWLGQIVTHYFRKAKTEQQPNA